MTDLVSRLREYGEAIAPFSGDGDTCLEAAERIEKLEAEVERLRAGKNECETEGCSNAAEYCLDCLDDATSAAYMDGSGEYR